MGDPWGLKVSRLSLSPSGPRHLQSLRGSEKRQDRLVVRVGLVGRKAEGPHPTGSQSQRTPEGKELDGTRVQRGLSQFNSTCTKAVWLRVAALSSGTGVQQVHWWSARYGTHLPTCVSGCGPDVSSGDSNQMLRTFPKRNLVALRVCLQELLSKVRILWMEL